MAMTSKHSANDSREAREESAASVLTAASYYLFLVRAGLSLGVRRSDSASRAELVILTLVLHPRRSESCVTNAYAVP